MGEPYGPGYAGLRCATVLKDSSRWSLPSYPSRTRPPARPGQRRLRGCGAGSPLLPLVAPERRPRPRCAWAVPAGPTPFFKRLLAVLAKASTASEVVGPPGRAAVVLAPGAVGKKCFGRVK